MQFYMLLAAAVAVLTACLCKFQFGGQALSKKRFIALSAAVLLMGFALRVLIGYYGEGFDTDLALFKAWAYETNEHGFAGVYSSGVYLDYPPGYLYVLALLEKLRLLFGIPAESQLFTLMIKLPSMLGDIFCSLVLLLFAKKRLPQIQAVFVTAAYLFCPAVIINSARWGQVDSFCLCFLLVSILLLWKKRYIPAALLFGVSIILKPQMLVFVPIYLFKVIRDKNYKMLFFAPLSAVAVILLVAAPFTTGFDYLWLVERYMETMNYYDYYTVNAYNIFAIFGLNWEAIPEGALGMALNVIGPVIATALTGFIYFKSKREDVLFICPGIIMATAYMFTVKMHERYLFHTLIFILLAYVLTRERRFVFAFAGMSFLHYVNVNYVLYLYNVKEGAYDPNEILVRVLGVLQLLSFVYLVYVTLRVFVFEKEDSARTWMPKLTLPEADSRMKKSDVFLMVLISGFYAVFAFWGLGASETANTSWTPLYEESAVFEAENPVSGICYLPGIAGTPENWYRVGTKVSIELSEDGISWTPSDDMPESWVYEWKRQDFPLSVRYVRFTALDSSVVLNEIAFLKQDKSGFETVKLLSGEGGALIDEQDAAPLYPSYYNGTYFDEIYHVRTAYEHTLGVEPYENTHPPLGKHIIALGIRIFGMNPFGWRFMGALFGVLMLPALYYLFKQLFGMTFFCTLGTLLFAFDFMHYTQTRIATIDTYAVFFILLMFGQMVRFMKKDLRAASLRELMPPLVLSGIFMGLGIASKWTVAYGALGLAALLFGKFFVSWRQEKERDGGDAQVLLWKIFRICLWCLLWFIALPFAIYFAAFLPQVSLHSERMFSSFVGYQTTMYNYHSTLEAEHFFSSPWYEWPLIIKPIWYSSRTNLADPGTISTISALGNPAVWWTGVPAILVAGLMAYKQRQRAAVVIIVGFCSVYLPWVMVSRIAFIYHYFTAVPFVVAALVLCMLLLSRTRVMQKELLSLRGGVLVIRYYHAVCTVFVCLAFAMFLVFLPVISGFATSADYANGLEWLPQWYFA